MNLAELLQAIADAIREKKNSVESINAQNFPEEILELSIGDGNSVNYVKVIWNEDDTISFVDTDGITHLMDCKYEDDKITEVIYNNEKIGINYKNDDLILINDTEIDLNNLKIKENEVEIPKIDHTVTFFADGELYEVVSVKDGNSVNAPATEPISENGSFAGWQLNEGRVDFPYPPENDVEIVALFGTLADEIYLAYNIRRKEYPYLLVYTSTYSYSVSIFFAKSVSIENNSININPISLTGGIGPGYNSRFNTSDVEAMKKYIIESKFTLSERTSEANIGKSDAVLYLNFDKGAFTGTTYNI